MSIVTAGSVNEFFVDAVGEAIKSRHVEATPAAANYIVGLLADFARPGVLAGQTMDRPLTFLLDEALHTPDIATRFERLRILGDGILYSSGFFADHFEARGVDQGYVIGLGATAYENAGALILSPSDRDPAFDIFRELATKFAAFVSVIADVAESTIAQGSKSAEHILKMYERWMKTKSDRLAGALSSHGFITPRGSGGCLS